MTTNNGFTTTAVLADVLGERHRQDARWGEQNHPNIPAEGMGSAALASRLLGIPDHRDARDWCEDRHTHGAGSWADILVEEVAEAVAAAAEAEDSDVRYELVQIAAVATAWIEAIDRRVAAPVVAGEA